MTMIPNYFHSQIETKRKIETKIIIIFMPREKRKDEAVSSGSSLSYPAFESQTTEKHDLVFK
jgi:hypothetical protein